MFEAMVGHSLDPHTDPDTDPGPDLDPAWETRCREVLTAGLARGDVFAFVVDAPTTRPAPGLAASAVVEVQQRFPSPWAPSGTLGYLSSVATDPAQRSRGYGRAVVRAALEECERRGIERVELHASPMGLDLYRSLGFVDRPGGRELRLHRDRGLHPSP
jgi:GNAT superfamily N-acetyltransferase